jgi:hypothetical protein
MSTNHCDKEFISIGPFCASAGMIKEANIQKCAYPFDYIFSSLSMVEHCIEDNFKTFLDDDEIYYNKEEFKKKHIDYICSSNKYYEKYLHNDIIIGAYKTNKLNHEFIPVFRHHNLTDNDVKEKFIRRCNRFLDIVKNNNKHYYFVYTINFCDNNIDKHISDLITFLNYIQKKNITYYTILAIHILEKVDRQIVYNSNNIIYYFVPSQEDGSKIIKMYSELSFDTNTNNNCS